MNSKSMYHEPQACCRLSMFSDFQHAQTWYLLAFHRDYKTRASGLVAFSKVSGPTLYLSINWLPNDVSRHVFTFVKESWPEVSVQIVQVYCESQEVCWQNSFSNENSVTNYTKLENKKNFGTSSVLHWGQTAPSCCSFMFSMVQSKFKQRSPFKADFHS